jgi:hypothetical protein
MHQQFQICHVNGKLWWLICASYSLSSFRFVTAKRQQNDNYHLFAPKRRQIDKMTKRKVNKTTKLWRKDDKYNPLISDLIRRLCAWRLVIFSPRKDDRTTRRQNDNCRLFDPKKRQNAEQKDDKLVGYIMYLSTFHLEFC